MLLVSLFCKYILYDCKNFSSHVFLLQVRLVPLEMPKTICGCVLGSQSVHPGKTVAVVTINGKNEVNLELT